VCFDDVTLQEVEDKIQNRFEEIKRCNNPEMLDPEQKHFKCIYMCDYYKMPSPDGKTNMCKFLHKETAKVGIDQVINQYTNKDFVVGQYNAPGEK